MTTYILKRVLTKLFSTDLTRQRDKIRSLTETTVIEFLKITLLSNSIGDRDLSHWINHLASTMTESGDPIKTLLGIVDNYKDLPKQFGESYVRDLRNNKSISEYIDDIFITLRNLKDETRGIKYAPLLPNKLGKSEKEALIQQMKFMALCLTGKLDPDNDNWWDNSVLTEPVNWNLKIKRVDSKELAKIFSNILGYPIK